MCEQDEYEDPAEEQVMAFLEECMENPEMLDLEDAVEVPEHVTTPEEFCEWIEEQDIG